MRWDRELGPQILLPRRGVNATAARKNDESDELFFARCYMEDVIFRLESLPGVKQRHVLLSNGTLATDYYVNQAFVRRFQCTTSQLLCHIDADGIVLLHLSASDLEEIVDKGWGFCVDGANSVFPPRDWFDVEIVWRIILLAYRHLTSAN